MCVEFFYVGHYSSCGGVSEEMLLPGKKILAPDKSLKVPWLVKCSIFTVVALANGVTPSAENDGILWMRTVFLISCFICFLYT